MTRSEKSIAIPTGMIIAALYVIMLVGFSQESYMRRDAAHRIANRSTSHQAVLQACPVEQPICASLFNDPDDRQICSVSVQALRQVVGGQIRPWKVFELRQTLGEP
jgi:hypothetical protein